jgi:hypothetical protein
MERPNPASYVRVLLASINERQRWREQYRDAVETVSAIDRRIRKDQTVTSYGDPDLDRLNAVLVALDSGENPPRMPDGSNALDEMVQVPGQGPKRVRHLTVEDWQAIRELFRGISSP